MNDILKTGDKVVVVDHWKLNGKIGTVVHIDSNPWSRIGVSFPNWDGGHSLEGKCINGRGWWLDNKYLKKINLDWNA
jgi:hypothetical protein